MLIYAVLDKASQNILSEHVCRKNDFGS